VKTLKAIIKPSAAKGRVIAPPSKSFAHRIMICASLADGISTISNTSESQDLLATADCICALGASIKKDGSSLQITGMRLPSGKSAVFPCRESGSTLRFLIPVACALFDSSVFEGSERLIERGISVYEDIFKDCGIEISKTEKSISFRGRLFPKEYTVSGNVSSQFVSGLLFALPLLDGDSKITVIPPVESKPYIDITLDVLAKFGIKITKCGENSYFIKGNQKYQPQNMTVTGDWSNSAVFFALNALGGDIYVEGLSDDSLQGDKVITEYIKTLKKENPVIDISACPDLAPVLFALAGALGGAEFTGTARLKIKESDRAEAMKDELLKFGIETKIFKNRAVIKKGTLKAPETALSSHNDHRIAMACSILATKTGGVICGIEAVSKSFPDFFKVLASLGVEVSYED
jgi:3-phosphoshikimate 1-carboxyvinyltransferase